MKLSMPLVYAGNPRQAADQVTDLERAGLDLVWVAEAYGFDSPTLMGYLAARTETVQIGAGILNVFSRTPGALLQTAAGLDNVSGGRAVIGLGASGPQVIEGFHGVPYEKPLGRTRDVVEIIRMGLRRETLRHDGIFTLPLPPDRGLGLGRELSAWAVAYLRSRGTETVRLYATGPAEGIYRSLGFREVGRRTVYRLDGPARKAATKSADVRRVDTLRFGDLPELYGVDLWGHGADRSPLIFSALRLRSGRGFVARDAAGRIEGYLILDASHPPVRLGPFAAKTTEAARRLLLRALEAAGDAPVRAIATGPDGCPSHDLFRQFGFVGREDRLRMELGEETAGIGGLLQYATTPFMAT